MTPQSIEIASLVNSQASLQEGSATKNGKEGNGEQGFLQFLDKALGRDEKEGLPCSQNITEGTGSKDDWLGSFKNALFASGIALKNMSLSSDALEGLRKLLLADGFSKEDVEILVKGLLKNKANKEISVLELMQKLSELKGKSGNKSDDFVLEASVLPHLEILLRSFGLTAHEVEGIISRARVDGGYLSLNALAQNLKTIVAESQKGVRTDMGEVSAETTREMLTRMGMAEEASKLNGPVSLERFVQLVEDKLSSLVPYRLSDAEGKKQVAGLLENVSVSAREKAVSSKRRDVELKGFPFQNLEAETNNKQGIKGFANARKKTAQKAVGFDRTGTDTKGEIDTKGLDIKKFEQLEANGDEITARVKKLVDAVTHRPSERTSDNNRWTATGVHDRVVNRAPAAENVAKSDARSIPMHVVNQVGKRLSLALRRGDNHLRLQLKPPHLGSIQLDLAMKDNGLKITMVAEHQYVKDLMVSHVDELREALLNQGVELEKIDVEINQHFGQSMANDDRQSHKARPWARTMASTSSEPGDGTIGVQTIARRITSDGQLDMFA